MPETTTQSRDCTDVCSPVCIHTQQITDSCLDKDCIDDLRVYLTQSSQSALESAGGVKIRYAELLYASVDTEPLAYKSGWYAVDVTFYYRIMGDALLGGMRPQTITGLAVFAKRAVLYGGKSKAKIFSSSDGLLSAEDLLQKDRPEAVLEALDPMVLSSRVRETDPCACDSGSLTVPEGVKCLFDEPLVISGSQRQLYVTLGQFSIVRLERDAQLVVPVLDYAVPCKECCDESGSGEDPCEMFSRIPFPTEQFSATNCDEETAAPTGPAE